MGRFLARSVSSGLETNSLSDRGSPCEVRQYSPFSRSGLGSSVASSASSHSPRSTSSSFPSSSVANSSCPLDSVDHRSRCDEEDGVDLQVNSNHHARAETSTKPMEDQPHSSRSGMLSTFSETFVYSVAESAEHEVLSPHDLRASSRRCRFLRYVCWPCYNMSSIVTCFSAIRKRLSSDSSSHVEDARVRSQSVDEFQHSKKNPSSRSALQLSSCAYFPFCCFSWRPVQGLANVFSILTRCLRRLFFCKSVCCRDSDESVPPPKAMKLKITGNLDSDTTMDPTIKFSPETIPLESPSSPQCSPPMILAVLLYSLVGLLFLLFGGYRMFSLESLKNNYLWISRFSRAHPWIALISYYAVVISTTVMSIPSGSVTMLLSGFLFGQPYALLHSVLGCVAGASVVYFLCQGSLREYLRDKLKKYFSHREAEIQKNLTFYMLFIRLLPGFPFAIANLLPALFTVSFFDYFWTTVVGILPSTLFLTQAGVSLHVIFSSNQPLSWNLILNHDSRIALIVLVIFSVLPILLRKQLKSLLRCRRVETLEEESSLSTPEDFTDKSVSESATSWSTISTSSRTLDVEHSPTMSDCDPSDSSSDLSDMLSPSSLLSESESLDRSGLGSLTTLRKSAFRVVIAP